MRQRSQKLYYLSEMLKAIGRIIAGVALLHFRAAFWTLRLCLLAELCFAAVQLVLHFRLWMLAGLVLIALGGGFIVWTHEIVKRVPITTKTLVTGGPFAVVRHPM